MTFKKLILLILILISLASCKVRWIGIENNDELVWKRRIVWNEDVITTQYSSNCVFINKLPEKPLLNENYSIFEFDSIRIYINKDDTLLNSLTSKGFVQGQYFFYDIETNFCNNIFWTNPTKFTADGWTGYHLYISNLRELTIERHPKYKNKNDKLSKIYRFSFRYKGQAFINPSVFRLKIVNPYFRFDEHDIDYDQFLHKAETVNFYHSGDEI